MKNGYRTRYGKGFGGEGYGRDTYLAHGGREKTMTNGVVNVPVVRASTVLFPTLDDLEQPTQARLRYGRDGTQSNFALQDWIKDYEGADAVWLTPSGLDANILALQHLCDPGRKILVADNVYMSTKEVCEKLLRPRGVDVIYYNPQNVDDVIDQLNADIQLIFMEAPGSSTFEMVDVAKITKVCKSKGIFTVLDHAWSAGYFYRPLEHGVDVAVQSASKYLAGHADVMMGVVSVQKGDAMDRLTDRQGVLSASVSPDSAWLVLRGARTLSVRLQRHQESAMEIAHWLEKEQDVVKVLYPALASFEGHDIWEQYYSGASGLMGVLLAGSDRGSLAALVDHMELFGMGASWGSFESLVLPHDAARASRKAMPFPAGDSGEATTLIRFHIGLEDVDDLKRDIKAGLERRHQAMKT